MPEVLDRRATAGQRRHPIRLVGTGDAVQDGTGGWTYPAAGPLSPEKVWATISPATAADLERLGGGTVVAQATHVLRFPYHPGVTTGTQIIFGTRSFSTIGVSNPGERNLETVVLAQEVLPQEIAP
jgi:head-tail adaptor